MKALLVLAVLLGLALVGDRVAVGAVEERVGVTLADRGALAGTPEVAIEGWPFLTQAVSGTYDDVRISLTAADLDQPEGTAVDVRLRGVHLPLSAVLGGPVQELPVDRIDATATLSYELLSRELGGDTTLAHADGGLRLTTTVQALGYTVPLVAVGQVRLDGDELVVDAAEASAAGVDVPDWLVDRAGDLIDLRYPVELPFGLRLTSVTPAEDGVHVTAEATDTVLRGP